MQGKRQHSGGQDAQLPLELGVKSVGGGATKESGQAWLVRQVGWGAG